MDADLQRGIALHQEGRLAEAQRVYEAVLAGAPQTVQALGLLGILAMQSGDAAAAIEWFSRWIAIDPDSNAGPFYNRAGAYLSLARFEAAIADYDRAIALESDLDANAHHGRGVALLELGRHADAEASFRLAIELGTTFSAESSLKRGFALAALGEHARALDAFDAAIDHSPGVAPAHKGRGTMLLALGRLPEAREGLERAHALAPEDAETCNNLGLALLRLGQFDAALSRFRDALELDPRLADAHLNASDVLFRLLQLDQALEHCEAALRLQPGSTAAHVNLARIFAARGQLPEALAATRKAVGLQPDSAVAWFIRGDILTAAKLHDEARDARRRALECRPGNAQELCARAALLIQMGDPAGAQHELGLALRMDPGYLAARVAAATAAIPVLARTADEAASAPERYAAALRELEEGLTPESLADTDVLVGALSPFYLAYQGEPVREALSRRGRLCARAMEHWQRRRELRRPVPVATAGSKLRVGIVSAHIVSHPVYDAITRGWLEQLDPERFSIDVFHLGARVDPQTRDAERRVAYFDQGPHSLGEWTAHILGRRPHVLIYPEVGMDAMTLQLAALRLADVQMAAWGHPVTTGLPTIDHFLSAEAFEPADGAQHYTERLVLLPRLGAYYSPVAYADGEPPTALPMNPEPSLICAGTPFKYLPQFDRLWVDIARRLGRCKLHFFEHQDGILSRLLMERLRGAFAAEGMDASDHIVLHRWMSSREFHGFLRGADLYLDTLEFSGFNTVMQALGCGLPVVSHRGRFMRGRFGSGILESLGAGELAADSPQAYADTVVRLAEDPHERARWRGHLMLRLPTLYRDAAAVEALAACLQGSAKRA
jgi:tetratricopeptide (TPR) repeat protein